MSLHKELPPEKNFKLKHQPENALKLMFKNPFFQNRCLNIQKKLVVGWGTMSEIGERLRVHLS